MVDRSRTHRWLALTAGALGSLALVAGDPHRAERVTAPADEVSELTALDIARWIRKGEPDLRLVDVRDDSLFAAYHIPGAERVTLDDLSRRAWPPEATVIVYADDDATATRAATVLRSGGVARVQVLRGGLLSWVDAIVEPRLAPLAATATPAEQAARREHLELSRYFGGTPVVAATARPLPAIPHRHREAAAAARILRRGC